MARIAVAMSGGVDSAVAAALLVEAGHQVTGFTMNLWPAWVPPADDGPGCCGLGAIDDARAVARTLGIPHYVLNLRDAFERAVIRDFAGEYARGRTPNPCIACNRAIKFSLLLARVRALGMDALATGHYARLAHGTDGDVRLLRAADRRKDQSYVLAGVRREQLARARFPVGAHTKPDIRAIARRLGLRVADKPDSQEICFVPHGDHGAVVARYAPHATRPGPVYDGAGRHIGEHRGVARYTVGQRRGLGALATAGGRPRYVVGIDAGRNALRVGDADALGCGELTAADANWLAVDALVASCRVTARIRHGGADVPAVLTPDAGASCPQGGRVRVRFAEPVRAAAPGQAIAFYDGDLVVGGAVIDEVASASSERRTTDDH
jgi:tRNA-specific 2-thiouridylase